MPMNPEDIRVGDRLRYHPDIARPHFIPVEILQAPRQLADGSWICKAQSLHANPDRRFFHASVEALSPSANLPRPKPPSRPFTLFGHLLGEEVRLERVARGGKSHLALLVSGTAHNPQGAWPEATIRIELSPLRLRLLAESLRVCAEEYKRRKRRATIVVHVPGPAGPQGVSR